MSKKSFIVFIIIFILSIAVAMGIPIIGFSLEAWTIGNGWPLKWTRFSFLGSESDYVALGIDIIFWFITIYIGWWAIEKLWKNLHRNKH